MRVRRRDRLEDPLMRAMAIVMPGVAAKDPFEVPCVDNEKMIEALGSNGPNEALGIGVGVRGPERGLEDLGTLGPKDLVEVRHVLRVTVADYELDVDPLVGDISGHVPGLLGDPRRVGMNGHSGNPDPSAADFDKE